MKFQAIACDYDSTLAFEGRVAPKTLQILRRARSGGRKLILITGRTLDDLRTVFSGMSLFDLVIGENGAVLFEPTTGSEKLLCDPLPASFVRALSQRRVPFSRGERVLATHRPYETAVEQVIRELSLGIHVALNRESVMVLPGGVDKASGLLEALGRLTIAPSQVVGIGDAENDFSFLRLCGLSAAVANAIESLKQQVDIVARGADGTGVSEIIEQVIAGGLESHGLIDPDLPGSDHERNCKEHPAGNPDSLV